jgi:hypothetical protein
MLPRQKISKLRIMHTSPSPRNQGLFEGYICLHVKGFIIQKKPRASHVSLMHLMISRRRDTRRPRARLQPSAAPWCLRSMLHQWHTHLFSSTRKFPRHIHSEELREAFASPLGSPFIGADSSHQVFSTVVPSLERDSRTEANSRITHLKICRDLRQVPHDRARAHPPPARATHAAIERVVGTSAPITRQS